MDSLSTELFAHWLLLASAFAILSAALLGSAYLFFRLKDDIKLNRKIQSLSGRVIPTETTDLLNKMRDTTTEDTILRLLPRLLSTKTRLKQSGLRLDLVSYTAIILLLSAAISLLWKNPLFPDWGDFAAPILNITVLHILANIMIFGPLMRRRKNRMLDQLSTAISHIARSLTAGQAIDVAIGLAGRAVAEPLRTQLLDIVRLTNVGYSTTDAMKAASSNIDLPEFDFLISAVEASDRSGGNLGRVLNELTTVIRGRTQLKLKIAAKTAEGKMSALILALLPVFLFAGFCIFDKPFVQPLFTSPYGKYIIGAAFSMIAIGLAVMMRIVRIRV